MKIASFNHQGIDRLGQVDAAAGIVSPFEIADLGRGVHSLLTMRELPPLSGTALDLADICLQPPLRGQAQRVFCVGKNYYDHVQETEAPEIRGTVAPPALPVIFSKLPQAIIGPGEPIRFDPTVSVKIDYEVELTAIIGKPGRNITPESALEHVWGYTILNDVTARDVQKRHNQWLLGKSQDTFCPIGPWAVTADEVDLSDCVVSTHVNGEERQNANTSLMIHDLPAIIATVST
ncbi:MAG: fumarylacetoacetate hydrolase family protein, partial [Pseudomonadota bacterium]